MKNLALSLALAAMCGSLTAWAENDERRFPNDHLSKRWMEYEQNTGGNQVRSYFFNDTVSVEEMTAAFYKYKDTQFKKSPYACADSVVYNIIHGSNLLLSSPLRCHADEQLQGMRGVWSWGTNRFTLMELHDKNGNPQPWLLKKVKEKLAKSKDWQEGDFVALRFPQHYMGFIVSPRISVVSYNSSSRMVGGSSTVRCHADFFSYASFCNTLDGDWQSKVHSGAALLGKCLTFYTNFTSEATPERSFSVLLYQTPESSNLEKEYTLKLLLPEQPDKETEKAFMKMKTFVENLRHNAYNPFYTADFRLMTGRYYHVTVNKCGWLVKDYMTLY